MYSVGVFDYYSRGTRYDAEFQNHQNKKIIRITSENRGSGKLVFPDPFFPPIAVF